MEVKLFSQKGKYNNKEGQERTYTNFYVKCGDKMIAVEPKYFGTNEKPDTGYSGRKAILDAFAEPLPPKEQ